jgi:hypothetical protein
VIAGRPRRTKARSLIRRHRFLAILVDLSPPGGRHVGGRLYDSRLNGFLKELHSGRVSVNADVSAGDRVHSRYILQQGLLNFVRCFLHSTRIVNMQAGKGGLLTLLPYHHRRRVRTGGLR